MRTQYPIYIIESLELFTRKKRKSIHVSTKALKREVGPNNGATKDECN